MKQRSLVLVTVDCLRADHVGFLGYSRSVTPALDSLAANSVIFSDAIVAGAPTYFSFPAILASRYPLGLGRDVVGIAPHEPTIATALQQHGYRTAAFLAGNPYLGARFGYDQGFDTFHDFLDTSGESETPDHIGKKKLSNLNRLIEVASRRTGLTAAAYDEIYFWYGQWRTRYENISLDTLRRFPAADVIVDQASSWLNGIGDGPFFLWLHLMDPHHPYYPREEALSALDSSKITARRARFLNSYWNRGDVAVRKLERFREEMLSLYDAGVYWVDKQISRLVSALQNRGRWDETVLVVTADHGEEFLDHGGRYHSLLGLREELIHVPLLLRVPELPAIRLSPEPFSLLHLAPTVLEGMGVPVPDSFRGQSCWQKICAAKLPNEPVITECIEGCNNPFRLDDRMRSRLLAVRDQRYKLVINFRENVDSLYDLGHDPGERSPVPPTILTQERARLLQIARLHLQNIRYKNTDLRLRARLRDLRQSKALIRASAQP